MRVLSCVLLVSLVGLAAGCGKKPRRVNGDDGNSPAEDLTAMQGDWEVERLEVEYPPEEPTISERREREKLKEKLKAVQIHVEGNMVKITTPPRKTPQYAVATLVRSDPYRSMDLVPSDSKGTPEFPEVRDARGKLERPALVFLAIYKLEGDTMVVAFGGGGGIAVRPTEFKAVPPNGKLGGVWVFHLKRKQ